MSVTPTSSMLVVHNLSIGYSDYILASDVNLSLGIGVTALIGRNGAGKSTLIRILTGAMKPLGGKVLLNGKDIKSYSKKDKAKLVSLVTTDSDMAGGLRLKELVGLGRTPYTGRFGLLSNKDNEIVERSMEMVGISHKKDAFVAQLSDGERQKGMIARGLAQETPIIIMDEPFSFLDVASRLELINLISRLSRKQNKSILYSTHEISEALKTADTIWSFSTDGISEGSATDLIQRGEMDRLFPDQYVKFDTDSLDFIYKNPEEK